MPVEKQNNDKDIEAEPVPSTSGVFSSALSEETLNELLQASVTTENDDDYYDSSDNEVDSRIESFTFGCVEPNNLSSCSSSFINNDESEDDDDDSLDVSINRLDRYGRPKKRVHFAAGVKDGPSRKRRKKQEKEYKPPSPLTTDTRDIFCWRCHKSKSGKDFIECTTCPRVFHLKCSQTDKKASSSHWSCIQCEDVRRSEHEMASRPVGKRLSITKLAELIRFVLARMRLHDALKQFENRVDDQMYPDYYKYIVKPMFIKLLEINMNNNRYRCCEAFLADARWMVHNSYIFNSAQAELTVIARTVVKAAKTECDEIDNCPHCYRSANTIGGREWFLEPCKIPHILVWARLKGFPYWPCKVMKIHGRLVDVRFFGDHNKAFVPIECCYLFSKTVPAKTKNKKVDGLDKAMEEIEIHIDKLMEQHVKFFYAPSRTPLDPKQEDFQRKLLLPWYGLDPNKEPIVPTKILGVERLPRVIEAPIIVPTIPNDPGPNNISVPDPNNSQLSPTLKPKVILGGRSNSSFTLYSRSSSTPSLQTNFSLKNKGNFQNSSSNQCPRQFTNSHINSFSSNSNYNSAIKQYMKTIPPQNPQSTISVPNAITNNQRERGPNRIAYCEKNILNFKTQESHEPTRTIVPNNSYVIKNKDGIKRILCPKSYSRSGGITASNVAAPLKGISNIGIQNAINTTVHHSVNSNKQVRIQDSIIKRLPKKSLMVTSDDLATAFNCISKEDPREYTCCKFRKPKKKISQNVYHEESEDSDVDIPDPIQAKNDVLTRLGYPSIFGKRNHDTQPSNSESKPSNPLDIYDALTSTTIETKLILQLLISLDIAYDKKKVKSKKKIKQSFRVFQLFAKRTFGLDDNLDDSTYNESGSSSDDSSDKNNETTSSQKVVGHYTYTNEIVSVLYWKLNKLKEILNKWREKYKDTPTSSGISLQTGKLKLLTDLPSTIKQSNCMDILNSDHSSYTRPVKTIAYGNTTKTTTDSILRGMNEVKGIEKSAEHKNKKYLSNEIKSPKNNHVAASKTQTHSSKLASKLQRLKDKFRNTFESEHLGTIDLNKLVATRDRKSIDSVKSMNSSGSELRETVSLLHKPEIKTSLNNFESSRGSYIPSINQTRMERLGLTKSLNLCNIIDSGIEKPSNLQNEKRSSCLYTREVLRASEMEHLNNPKMGPPKIQNTKTVETIIEDNDISSIKDIFGARKEASLKGQDTGQEPKTNEHHLMKKSLATSTYNPSKSTVGIQVEIEDSYSPNPSDGFGQSHSIEGTNYSASSKAFVKNKILRTLGQKSRNNEMTNRSSLAEVKGSIPNHTEKEPPALSRSLNSTSEKHLGNRPSNEWNLQSLSESGFDKNFRIEKNKNIKSVKPAFQALKELVKAQQASKQGSRKNNNVSSNATILEHSGTKKVYVNVSKDTYKLVDIYFKDNSLQCISNSKNSFRNPAGFQGKSSKSYPGNSVENSDTFAEQFVTDHYSRFSESLETSTLGSSQINNSIVESDHSLIYSQPLEETISEEVEVSSGQLDVPVVNSDRLTEDYINPSEECEINTDSPQNLVNNSDQLIEGNDYQPEELEETPEELKETPEELEETPEELEETPEELEETLEELEETLSYSEQFVEVTTSHSKESEASDSDTERYHTMETDELSYTDGYSQQSPNDLNRASDSEETDSASDNSNHSVSEAEGSDSDISATGQAIENSFNDSEHSVNDSDPESYLKCNNNGSELESEFNTSHLVLLYNSLFENNDSEQQSSEDNDSELQSSENNDSEQQLSDSEQVMDINEPEQFKDANVMKHNFMEIIQEILLEDNIIQEKILSILFKNFFSDNRTGNKNHTVKNNIENPERRDDCGESRITKEANSNSSSETKKSSPVSGSESIAVDVPEELSCHENCLVKKAIDTTKNIAGRSKSNKSGTSENCAAHKAVTSIASPERSYIELKFSDGCAVHTDSTANDTVISRKHPGNRESGHTSKVKGVSQRMLRNSVNGHQENSIIDETKSSCIETPCSPDLSVTESTSISVSRSSSIDSRVETVTDISRNSTTDASNSNKTGSTESCTANVSVINMDSPENSDGKLIIEDNYDESSNHTDNAANDTIVNKKPYLESSIETPSTVVNISEVSVSDAPKCGAINITGNSVINSTVKSVIDTSQNNIAESTKSDLIDISIVNIDSPENSNVELVIEDNIDEFMNHTDINVNEKNVHKSHSLESNKSGSTSKLKVKDIWEEKFESFGNESQIKHKVDEGDSITNPISSAINISGSTVIDITDVRVVDTSQNSYADAPKSSHIDVSESPVAHDSVINISSSGSSLTDTLDFCVIDSSDSSDIELILENNVGCTNSSDATPKDRVIDDAHEKMGSTNKLNEQDISHTNNLKCNINDRQENSIIETPTTSVINITKVSVNAVSKSSCTNALEKGVKDISGSHTSSKNIVIGPESNSSDSENIYVKLDDGWSSSTDFSLNDKIINENSFLRNLPNLLETNVKNLKWLSTIPIPQCSNLLEEENDFSQNDDTINNNSFLRDTIPKSLHETSLHNGLKGSTKPSLPLILNDDMSPSLSSSLKDKVKSSLSSALKNNEETNCLKDNMEASLPYPLIDNLVPSALKDNVKGSLHSTLKDNFEPSLPNNLKDNMELSHPNNLENNSEPSLPNSLKDDKYPTLPYSSEDNMEPSLPSLENNMEPSLPNSLKDNPEPTLPNSLEDNMEPSLLNSLKDNKEPTLRNSSDDNMELSLRNSLKDNKEPTLPSSLKNSSEPSLPNSLEDDKDPTLPNSSEDNIEPNLPNSLKDNKDPTLPNSFRDNSEPSLPNSLKDNMEPSLPNSLKDNFEPSEPNILESNMKPSLSNSLKDIMEPSLPNNSSNNEEQSFPSSLKDKADISKQNLTLFTDFLQPQDTDHLLTNDILNKGKYTTANNLIKSLENKMNTLEQKYSLTSINCNPHYSEKNKDPCKILNELKLSKFKSSEALKIYYNLLQNKYRQQKTRSPSMFDRNKISFEDLCNEVGMLAPSNVTNNKRIAICCKYVRLISFWRFLLNRLKNSIENKLDDLTSTNVDVDINVSVENDVTFSHFRSCITESKFYENELLCFLKQNLVEFNTDNQGCKNVSQIPTCSNVSEDHGSFSQCSSILSDNNSLENHLNDLSKQSSEIDCGLNINSDIGMQNKENGYELEQKYVFKRIMLSTLKELNTVNESKEGNKFDFIPVNESSLSNKSVLKNKIKALLRYSLGISPHSSGDAFGNEQNSSHDLLNQSFEIPPDFNMAEFSDEYSSQMNSLKDMLKTSLEQTFKSSPSTDKVEVSEEKQVQNTVSLGSNSAHQNKSENELRLPNLLQQIHGKCSLRTKSVHQNSPKHELDEEQLFASFIKETVETFTCGSDESVIMSVDLSHNSSNADKAVKKVSGKTLTNHGVLLDTQTQKSSKTNTISENDDEGPKFEFDSEFEEELSIKYSARSPPMDDNNDKEDSNDEDLESVSNIQNIICSITQMQNKIATKKLNLNKLSLCSLKNRLSLRDKALCRRRKHILRKSGKLSGKLLLKQSNKSSDGKGLENKFKKKIKNKDKPKKTEVCSLSEVNSEENKLNKYVCDSSADFSNSHFVKSNDTTIFYSEEPLEIKVHVSENSEQSTIIETDQSKIENYILAKTYHDDQDRPKIEIVPGSKELPEGKISASIQSVVDNEPSNTIEGSLDESRNFIQSIPVHNTTQSQNEIYLYNDEPPKKKFCGEGLPFNKTIATSHTSADNKPSKSMEGHLNESQSIDHDNNKQPQNKILSEGEDAPETTFNQAECKLSSAKAKSKAYLVKEQNPENYEVATVICLEDSLLETNSNQSLLLVRDKDFDSSVSMEIHEDPEIVTIPRRNQIENDDDDYLAILYIRELFKTEEGWMPLSLLELSVLKCLNMMSTHVHIRDHLIESFGLKNQFLKDEFDNLSVIINHTNGQFNISVNTKMFEKHLASRIISVGKFKNIRALIQYPVRKKNGNISFGRKLSEPDNSQMMMLDLRNTLEELKSGNIDDAVKKLEQITQNARNYELEMNENIEALIQLEREAAVEYYTKVAYDETEMLTDAVKSKSWCILCQKEAKLHCCFEGRYCSDECQMADWITHKKSCGQVNMSLDDPYLQSSPAVRLLMKSYPNMSVEALDQALQLIQKQLKCNKIKFPDLPDSDDQCAPEEYECYSPEPHDVDDRSNSPLQSGIVSQTSMDVELTEQTIPAETIANCLKVTKGSQTGEYRSLDRLILPRAQTIDQSKRPFGVKRKYIDSYGMDNSKMPRIKSPINFQRIIPINYSSDSDEPDSPGPSYGKSFDGLDMPGPSNIRRNCNNLHTPGPSNVSKNCNNLHMPGPSNVSTNVNYRHIPGPSNVSKNITNLHIPRLSNIGKKSDKSGSSIVNMNSNKSETLGPLNISMNSKKPDTSGPSNVCKNSDILDTPGTSSVVMNTKQLETLGLSNVDINSDQPAIPGPSSVSKKSNVLHTPGPSSVSKNSNVLHTPGPSNVQNSDTTGFRVVIEKSDIDSRTQYQPSFLRQRFEERNVGSVAKIILPSSNTIIIPKQPPNINPLEMSENTNITMPSSSENIQKNELSNHPLHNDDFIEARKNNSPPAHVEKVSSTSKGFPTVVKGRKIIAVPKPTSQSLLQIQEKSLEGGSKKPNYILAVDKKDMTSIGRRLASDKNGSQRTLLMGNKKIMLPRTKTIEASNSQISNGNHSENEEEKRMKQPIQNVTKKILTVPSSKVPLDMKGLHVAASQQKSFLIIDKNAEAMSYSYSVSKPPKTKDSVITLTQPESPHSA